MRKKIAAATTEPGVPLPELPASAYAKDAKPLAPAALAATPFAHVDDEHWGRGGRYVVDPATGRRRPADAPTPNKE